MGRERVSQRSPAESTTQRGSANEGVDSILEYMRRNGLPLTRSVYLDLAFPEVSLDPEEPLDAELEVQLPEAFRLGAK